MNILIPMTFKLTLLYNHNSYKNLVSIRTLNPDFNAYNIVRMVEEEIILKSMHIVTVEVKYSCLHIHHFRCPLFGVSTSNSLHVEVKKVKNSKAEFHFGH